MKICVNRVNVGRMRFNDFLAGDNSCRTRQDRPWCGQRKIRGSRYGCAAFFVCNTLTDRQYQRYLL